MVKKIILAATLSFAIAAQAQTVIDTRGDMYYGNGCYNRAFTEYMKAYAKSPDKPELLKRIAETIMAGEMPRDTAIFFIEKYIEKVPDDAEAYYIAAKAQYHAHNFTAATKHLNNFMTIANDEATIGKGNRLKMWIENARRMMRDTLTNRLVNLGENINTPLSEINPFVIGDDKTLVFSSDEKYNSAAQIQYYNIKFSLNEGLDWTKSRNVSGVINSLYDEYVVGITETHMIYTSNRDVNFALYQTQYRGNGRFGEEEKFIEPIDMKGDEVAATMTQNGDTIIFSGTTQNGKLDLYYSIKTNGQWREARPLPGAINTSDYDDNYPTLSRDGRRLYFASDRESSMGGYDLYYSDMGANGEWGKPVQLPYPINDTYDNMTISFSPSGRYTYLSLIRKGGYGQRDIYALVDDKVPPTSAIIRFTVNIKEGKQRPLKEMPAIKVFDKNNQLVAEMKMNMETSSFVVALDAGTYTLQLDSPEAQSYTETITVAEKTYDQNIIEREIILAPATKSQH